MSGKSSVLDGIKIRIQCKIQVQRTKFVKHIYIYKTHQSSVTIHTKFCIFCVRPHPVFVMIYLMLLSQLLLRFFQNIAQSIVRCTYDIVRMFEHFSRLNVMAFELEIRSIIVRTSPIGSRLNGSSSVGSRLEKLSCGHHNIFILLLSS